MFARAFIIGICALTTGALLLGCGGSDDGGDGGEPLTKAEFVKKANALCAASKKQIQTEFRAIAKRGSSQEDPTTALVEEAVVPGLEEEIQGIDELGAPSGDEDQVEAVTEEIQRVVDEAADDPEAFSSSALDPYLKSWKVARAYGIAECGTPNSPS